MRDRAEIRRVCERDKIKKSLRESKSKPQSERELEKGVRK